VSQFLSADFARLRRALDEGATTSRALTEESLRRAQASNPELNAYLSFSADEALRAADAADARLKAGERAPLLGVPIAVKDLILTRGHETTAASKMLKGFIPPYDATVVAKLRAAGAPIVGKTNLDEFAMGSSNETSFFGACRNPWDLQRVPGGSSGGSGAAVAARTTPVSLGTDTGGSIRQPSALCGITGLKPTYGRVSRFGVVAFASSLDQVGPMCADALSCAATLETISGHDVHDATSSRRAVPAFFEAAKRAASAPSMKGLRVGLPREYFQVEGLSPEVRTQVDGAIERLRALGAETVEVSLPHTRFALPVYYLVCTSEASSNLARYDGIHYGHRSSHPATRSLEDLYARSRGEGFGDEVRLRVLLGTYALSSGYYDAFYKKASQVRALIKRDFTEAFAKCDLIAGPTSPTTAFKVGEKFGDPVSMYLADVYTLSVNLAGVPGASFNAGFDSKGLPVGLQLIGRWWEEETLLNTAAAFQAVHPESLAAPSFTKRWGGA
jgi:aspartyl-tRNA(Asn)/glutamyl-tRNA(Gln) amidotransferase subunit A